MAKYKTGPSKETEQAALQAAKATQRPGQTKEQTKLIAQGIQKGIEHYKKQHKSKARKLDKKLRNVSKSDNHLLTNEHQANSTESSQSSWKNKLGWVLLLLSWSIFAVYYFK